MSELQRLLYICENELIWLDMSIDVNKSCCMRIGPRFDFKCCSIVTMSGHSLPWTKELKYLGIIIVMHPLSDVHLTMLNALTIVL